MPHLRFQHIDLVIEANSYQPPQPCFLTDPTFTKRFFQKGHQKNFSEKLFQNLTFGLREEEFQRVSLQFKEPHYGHVYRRIKISRTNLEKGHTRDIFVKLFQNLTIGFRGEDF